MASIRSNKSSEAGDLRDLAAGNAQVRGDSVTRATTGKEVADNELLDSLADGTNLVDISPQSTEEIAAAKDAVTNSKGR